MIATEQGMNENTGGAVNEKIRRYRLARNLTLEQLGKLCRLTKGYLSKVERGEKAPPVATLQIIATVLGVDLTEFFDTTAPGESPSLNLDILRKDQGKPAEADEVVTQSGYAYKPLLSSFKNKYMSPFLMRVKKGKTESFSHDSEEFAYVIEGTIELFYEGKSHIFEVGDSFYFDSRKPHYFVNHKNQDAVLVSVNFNYRRF
jgi:transcriptional regulator with XRE-family HTH domain